jgi:class 3 adenylate cyclase
MKVGKEWCMETPVIEQNKTSSLSTGLYGIGRTGERFAVRRRAVVLYAELRNFTRVADVLEPVTALELASEFFEIVTQAAKAQGGEVLATHNDAAMAVFRHGQAAQYSLQAVRTAQAVQRQFSVLEDRWRNEHGLHTAVAMGLHLGETVFGAAGAAGAERFVAFGDTVYIASRLMERARAGEFVVSDAVMGALAIANIELGAEVLEPLELSRRAALGAYGVLLDAGLDFT